MYLSRDDILKAEDLPTEDVSAWGGVVRVRGLTAREAVEYESSQLVQRDGEFVRDTDNTMAKLVSLCVIDADGNRLFPTLADAAALGEKSGLELVKVFEVAARLSGLSEDAVEDAGKDSGPTPSGDSSSPSPGTSATPARKRS